MKKDLIFMKRAYNLYDGFIKNLTKICKENDIVWDISWIIEAIQYIDWNNYNIEHYLFMKYWEAFISEILQISNDPSK